MAILTTVLSAALALTTQQVPTSDQITGAPFHQARAFPRNVGVLVSWNPNVATPWPRIVEALPRELQGALPQLAELVAERSALTPAQLEAIADARGTFGVWTDTSSIAGFGWLLTLDCGGNADALVSALETVTGEPLDAGLKIATLTTPIGLDVTFGRHGDTLMFGSDTETLEDATIRLDQAENASRSVLDNVRFQRFLAQCQNDVDSRDSFVSCFADVTHLVDSWIALASTEERGRIVAVRDALKIGQIFAVGYFARSTDVTTHEHIRICFPEPRTGIPGLLAGGGKVDDQMAYLIPVSAPTYSSFHFNTDLALSTVTDCLSAIDADAARALRDTLSTVQAAGGIDVEKDIIAALGKRFVMMQWPNRANDMALAVSLRQPLAISEALTQTRSFRKTVTDGFELFQSPTLPISVAIGEGHLILSSSDARMREILAHAAADAPNQDVVARLKNAPPNTSALSHTDLGALLEGHLSTIAGFVPTQSSWQHYVGDVLPALGGLTTYVTTNAAGVSMHSTSQLGSVGTFTAIGLAAGLSFASEVDPSLASSGIARRAEFAWRLGEIAAAVRDSHAHTLEDLVANGSADEALLGTQQDDGHFVVDGYRLTMFRDNGTDRFVVVAWPDEQARGDVYACAEDGAPIVNEILTHSAGVAKISLRDVYFDGKFDTKLMSGWQHIAVTDVATDSDGAVELSGEDWNIYQLLTAAADGTLELNSKDIIQHLRSSNPIIVGRAAMTIEALSLVDAIPTLGDAAPNPDVVARRQIAKALHSLDDRSTLTTTRQMLLDPDSTVRAFAAANAGKHRDAESVAALLDVIVRPEPTAGDADRVQALLSLADIGDSSCLDVACAVPLAGKAQNEAMAYLLQQLSPNLEPSTEANLLMRALSHEASIVRRYAIQRLGELRDPNTATALEGRLGRESAELRPLLEVSLSAIRGGTRTASAEQAAGVVDRLRSWYRGLSKGTRDAIIYSFGSFALIILGAMTWTMMRRRRGQTDWAAMAAPSEEFEVEEHASDGLAPDDSEPFEYGESSEELPYDEADRGATWGEAAPDLSAFDDYEFAEEEPRPTADR